MASSSPKPDAGSKLVPVLPEWGAVHSAHYHFLANQQAMLEDRERTGAYRQGIVGNRADFAGKVVLDVGAGTGILSAFAALAGARKVYAVEGTATAEHARRLFEHNGMSDRVVIVKGQLAELSMPEPIDVIISEPWGFFLFHERMVEAFLIARDRFLRPGGTLFPTTGRLWLAPFVDQKLFEGRVSRKKFWEQTDFFGVDLSGLGSVAAEELSAMPALGFVPPRLLMASPVVHGFDFRTVPLDDLAEIVLPFEFVATHPGTIHGLAGWFDVTFEGTTERVVLSTAPDAPRTHWAQLRFVFAKPLEVHIGDTLRGRLVMRANPMSSYDAHFAGELEGKKLPEQEFRIHSYFWWDTD